MLPLCEKHSSFIIIVDSKPQKKIEPIFIFILNKTCVAKLPNDKSKIIIEEEF